MNSDSGEMEEQKSSEDWLPPGWTVDVRVRKNGKTDKCYTNPSNGVKFFSKSGVFRFLNNIGNNRPVSKGHRNGSCKRAALNSPDIAERLNLADSRPNGLINHIRSSELDREVKDEKILESCSGREGTSSGCFNLKEAMVLEQREKSGPINSLGLTSAVLPKSGVENPGNKRTQLGLNQLNDKKSPDLPRRASKRLAGIELDPIPELKTCTRARRVSARRLDEAEASTAQNSGTSAASDERGGAPKILPPGNQSISEEHALQVDTDYKAVREPGSPVNFSLKDLWLDPCIEFAIKTLTDAIPIGDEDKVAENEGSSLEFPFGDSWGDPCIEFAVKTLTGAIPVFDDSGIQEGPDDSGIQEDLQQQLASSETKGDEGSNSLDVGLNHLCNTGNRRALLTSAAPHTGRLNNSGGAGIHPHCVGRRSEDCQRQTIHG